MTRAEFIADAALRIATTWIPEAVDGEPWDGGAVTWTNEEAVGEAIDLANKLEHAGFAPWLERDE
jgi:hypothetical protein